MEFIAVTSRPKNQKYRCSKCGKECFCIAIGNSDRLGKRNYCNYRFCPFCGEEAEDKK